MGDRTLKTAMYQEFARVGKALASPRRLELLDLLAQGERSVEVLAGRADLGLTTASNHLQILKQAGLVSTRKEGTKVYYRLAGTDIAALWAELRDVASTHLAKVDRVRSAYLGADDVDEVTRDELLSASKQVTSHSLMYARARSTPPVTSLVHCPYRSTNWPTGSHHYQRHHNRRLLPRPLHCVLAREAVRALTASGLHAIRLRDGMLEWRLANLPVAV